ncbi:MAG: 4Fe-4S binding protein, partial [Gammaproteobacteria bacterium]|nr:4Fe-4S binding protein [Gammaproteobacteria bacterium]
IIESECTGCNLCIPPCPVDCIHIFEVKPTVRSWIAKLPDADDAAPRAS